MGVRRCGDIRRAATIVDFVLEEWGWGGGGATGVCAGTVTDEDGESIEGATVSLQSSGWGWGWGWGGNWYFAESLEDGSFLIEDVEVGEYSASAFAWGIGWDSEDIEIFEGETTVVDFVLEEWGWGGFGDGIVELRGTVILEQMGATGIYCLDTNGDLQADYKLNFGPDWYYPPSGAARPEFGDHIELVGAVLGHAATPIVIVYEKDTMFWREPLQTTPELIERIRDRLRHNNPEDQIRNRSLVDVSSYPNPFNPEITIAYTLTDAAEIYIAVYNVLGQKVAQLVDGNMQAGSHQVKWNAVHHSSGFYFLQIETANQTMTKKILLTK